MLEPPLRAVEPEPPAAPLVEPPAVEPPAAPLVEPPPLEGAPVEPAPLVAPVEPAPLVDPEPPAAPVLEDELELMRALVSMN